MPLPEAFTTASGSVQYAGDIGHAMIGLTNGLKVARLVWRGRCKYLVLIGNAVTMIEHTVDSNWKPDSYDLLATDYAVDPAFLTTEKE